MPTAGCRAVAYDDLNRPTGAKRRGLDSSSVALKSDRPFAFYRSPEMPDEPNKRGHVSALKFIYDAWNNLVRVRGAFDGDVTVATYVFAADDRRASRTVTNRGGLNGVTYYFYDGHEVIEERDGSGAVVQQ